MFRTNPLMLIDFYKAVHEEQYPEGTERIVSYYTPRKSRLDDKYCLVHFGLQYFLIEYLIDWFDNEFFRKPIDKIRENYERYVESSIPDENELFPKIEALHKLGYLPLEIKSLPEGTIVPMGVPCVQIANTHKDFAWVVNTVESLLSNTLWHSQIAASVGYWYRQIVNEYYDLTVDDDVPRAKAMSLFSYRGEESNESGILSSAGWLTSFVLSATVPSAQFMENYYNANVKNEEVNFGAVSTEHSVMCSNYAVDGDEITMVKRLLNDIYPNTSFSMVADSYDYWNMVDNILPQCKEDIMRHNGKLNIRGDSGAPVNIVVNTVLSLWENFGGTVNSKGYKVLDPHIGVVYGDSITISRAKSIYDSLEYLGFAANNVSLGAGSFSMQCLEEVVIEEPTKFETQALQPFTRDTYCSAVKATYCEVNGEPIPIYKDPKTDDGHFKKSHKGCCVVTEKADGGLMCIDGLTYEDACSWKGNLLETVYQNSSMVRRDSLSYIRNRLHEGKF